MGAPAREAVGLYSAQEPIRAPSRLRDKPFFKKRTPAHERALPLKQSVSRSETRRGARRDNLTKPVTIPGARELNANPGHSPPHTAQRRIHGVFVEDYPVSCSFLAEDPFHRAAVAMLGR